jgi:hypothetical protein
MGLGLFYPTKTDCVKKLCPLSAQVDCLDRSLPGGCGAQGLMNGQGEKFPDMEILVGSRQLIYSI